jgi:Siphovirus Gp157
MTDFSAVTARVRALQEQLRTEGYDDEDVIASIESETDLFRVFDRVAEKIDQDNRSAVIARARAKRLETRADRNTEFLDFLMRTIGNQTKIERPTATVFYQTNPAKLEIDPDTRLADSLLTVVPDKPAIVKALKAGEDIPGCRLTQSRSLRVKTL